MKPPIVILSRPSDKPCWIGLYTTDAEASWCRGEGPWRANEAPTRDFMRTRNWVLHKLFRFSTYVWLLVNVNK